MPQPSRRALLRANTSKAHAALDSMVGSFDSVQSYCVYLRGISIFRKAVEHDLATVEWPDRLPAWRSETFSDLIAADLDDLDLPAAPAIDTPPTGREAEDVIGMLYVLEGSALGARLLYKRAQALGLSAEYGARHLASQSQRSDRWASFLTLLETAEAIDMGRVADASLATFETAEKAFRQVTHGPV